MQFPTRVFRTTLTEWATAVLKTAGHTTPSVLIQCKPPRVSDMLGKCDFKHADAPAEYVPEEVGPEGDNACTGKRESTSSGDRGAKRARTMPSQKRLSLIHISEPTRPRLI
eukprot:3942795-Amphidinium_carterae.2